VWRCVFDDKPSRNGLRSETARRPRKCPPDEERSSGSGTWGGKEGLGGRIHPPQESGGGARLALHLRSSGRNDDRGRSRTGQPRLQGGRVSWKARGHGAAGGMALPHP
jgi:hypothetical protein